MSNVTSVKIRMYDTSSVGDCLLLLFYKGKELSFKMMIDCGGWNADADTISECVKDIADVTGGNIDLLVVTHQHEDHISGFNQARAVFDSMITVNEVWMSWIEDSTDPIGQVLKDMYGKKMKELKLNADRAMKQLKAMSRVKYKSLGYRKKVAAKNLKMEETLKLIDFELGKSHGKGLAAGKRTNDDAMEYVRKKGNRVAYRLPGEVLSMNGAEGVRFYILGPPRDEDMRFFKINEDEDEMYSLRAAVGARKRGRIDNNILSTGIKLVEGVSPFAMRYQLDGDEMEAFNKGYDSDDFKWRQIETDWLESAASIAMRATRLTNNTSLAMALEFAGSHRVILLPADAQSGNWLGWHKDEVTNQLKKEGGLHVRELLGNTIFYKVGHHGSHNGTASKSGLDQMNHKDLVAMMPLIQAKIPDGWGGSDNFPAKALYTKLIEKTKGRLIRTDEGLAKDERAEKLRDELSASDKADFKKSFKKGSRYVEFEVKA